MSSYEETIKKSAELDPSRIEIGEIRRVIDMELLNDSRLVVALKHDRADDSYLVALVSNQIEVATPQDLLFSSEITGAAFDIAVLPEFSTKVWKQQLDSSPTFGVLPEELAHEILILVSGLSSAENPSNIPRGEYEVEFADHVWLYRGKEIDALNLLGHSVDTAQSNARFFEIWRNANVEISLVDILLENSLELDLLDNFLTNDSIRMELV